MHNPANEISDIISEGINQSGKVAATEAHNKKELMPLVTSKTDPNTAHLMFDKFNVYRNILLIIVKMVIIILIIMLLLMSMVLLVGV